MGGKKATKKRPPKVEKKAIDDASRGADRLQERIDAIAAKAALEAQQEPPDEDPLEPDEGPESGDDFEVEGDTPDEDGIPPGVDAVYMLMRWIHLVGGASSWVIGVYDTKREAEGHKAKADAEIARLIDASLMFRGKGKRVTNTGQTAKGFLNGIGLQAIKHDVIPVPIGDLKIIGPR